jgi:hypothetical protein
VELRRGSERIIEDLDKFRIRPRVEAFRDFAVVDEAPPAAVFITAKIV